MTEQGREYWEAVISEKNANRFLKSKCGSGAFLTVSEAAEVGTLEQSLLPYFLFCLIVFSF